jgi:hypothetical protein
MTTRDYPGETDYPAPADDATPIADPQSERLVGAATAPEPMSPDAVADPAWQQRADQFAANRDHRDDVHSTPDQTEQLRGDELGDNRRVDETDSETALFGNVELDELRQRWDGVQAGFVDDPKHCVEQADGLVSDVVDQLSSGFADARSRLEQQWSRGEQASTEDLRVALKRYREFFDRLLAV